MYPALAVADALLAVPGQPGEPNGPGAALSALKLVYVGSADGMERGLVARESTLPFEAISAAAVRGRNPLALGRNLLTLARGAFEARSLLRRLRPAAILGTGGYVCVPLFLAARALRVPTIIYLPDVVPGLAVRVLAKLSSVVACNVEDSARYLRVAPNQLQLVVVPSDVAGAAPVWQPGQKYMVTGYPVRGELFAPDQAACRAAFGLEAAVPTIVVYGGSRGARSVNKAIAALLPHLLPLAQIIHVCGREGDETFLREAAATLPAELQARYRLYPYLFSGPETEHDQNAPQPTMTRAFGAADLAVCRSGASTLAELPAAGLPAVLVPYPFVHQEENADYLVARGAAHKVQDDAMLGTGNPEDGPLFQQVRGLLLAPEERLRMSERSRALARPDAARRIAALLFAVASSTRT